MKQLSQEYLAEMIKKQRTKKDLTQEQLSEKTGI